MDESLIMLLIFVGIVAVLIIGMIITSHFEDKNKRAHELAKKAHELAMAKEGFIYYNGYIRASDVANEDKIVRIVKE